MNRSNSETRSSRAPGTRSSSGSSPFCPSSTSRLIYLADDPNLDTVIYALNGLFSVIFLADFTYRLFTADSKSRYFLREFGWADLFASLPFPQAKVLRIFRLIRVTRLLRGYGINGIVRSLVKDRAGSALFTLLLMGILVLEFGSLWILHLEQYAPGTRTSRRHPMPFGMSSSPSPQSATATSSR